MSLPRPTVLVSALNQPGSVPWRFSIVAALAALIGVLSCVSIGATNTGQKQNSTPPTQTASTPNTTPQDGSQAKIAASRGLEIVQHGGYPELRVDGSPFFIYSAAFFYYRTPRDMWEATLDHYRSLGINTLDLYIPWNWHEPKEGDLDFDGHSNPRRDLRTLLSLITQKRFKLIARPGPEILNEWRFGGYPGWLLNRPEYHMDPLDWTEGRYPPLDNLNTHDAEAAAHGWLDNPTHMEATKAWFAAVAKELAPYSSKAVVRLKPESRDSLARDVSGPLLFVQLGDDFAINRTNHVGPDFWRYVQGLRGMLVSAGLDVPVFINPTDMRVSAAGTAQNPPIGVMGQWYMRPREAPTAEKSALTPPRLTTQDVSEIEFFSEELKTQPDFPPAMIEYQAGWYAPADDDRPRPNLPENTLLSSRLLIANGVHGFNYFPLQDAFTPARCSVPWANASYRWDAALSPSGDPQPRLEAVRRNSQLLQIWGPLLAASHKRADFGIVYPLGAYPQDLLTPQDIHTVSNAVIRLERLANLGTISTELVDPEYQPVEQLLRDAALFLPTFDVEKPQFQLSDRAQSTIVAYVRRGGIVIIFPERPHGKTIEQLWRDVSPSSAITSESAIRARWKFGEGEVIESSKDFYSWLALDRSLAVNRSQQESGWSIGVLNEFVAAAGIRPTIKFSGKPTGIDALFLSEIVTNEGTGALGNRTASEGFLSATNLAEHETAEADVDVLSPAASATRHEGTYSPFHLVVPPHESLLLPLDIPLCFSDPQNAPCGDSIPVAGAEFLGARRDGKTLELTFYIPARSEIHVHLDEKPDRVSLDETDAKPDSTWVPAPKELQLTIPRGAAPAFRRTLKLALQHTPHVPEPDKHSQPNKAPPEDLEYYVQNAVRFPTSGSAFLRTYPALIVPDDNGKMNVLLIAENQNESASGYLDLSFDKPLHGYKNIPVPPHGSASEVIEFRTAEAQPPSGSPPPAVHLFHAAIEVRTGHDRRVLPIAALLHSPGSTENYRFDFDRDGADEWVLENDRLRLIVSPESGGRALALVDKSSGVSLASSVGLFRDNFSFTENPPAANSARPRGKYGLFNRSYAPSWTGDDKTPALHLQYDAPDIFPAGANIEKTIQLDGADGVRVDYRVSLSAKNGGSAPSASAQSQSFAIVNSFPLDASLRPGSESAAGNLARFCWQKPVSTQPSDAGASNSSGDDGEDCAEFTPNGKAIEVPQGATSVVVHSPGRAGIEVNWDCAAERTCPQMTIEPKLFSALFRLQFPPLTPGAEASHYSMRIRVLDTP